VLARPLLIRGEPTKDFAMTLQDLAERRASRKPTKPCKHRPERQEGDLAAHRDRVLTFRQWCEINQFSKATGRRLIRATAGGYSFTVTAIRSGAADIAIFAQPTSPIWAALISSRRQR
jgi:hypothetical protein